MLERCRVASGSQIGPYLLSRLEVTECHYFVGRRVPYSQMGDRSNEGLNESLQNLLVNRYFTELSHSYNHTNPSSR